MVILPYDTESKSRNVLASPLGEEGHEVAKGCTRVRMIMILDVDVTAERRHYNTHRPLKGKRLTTFCASLALLQNVFAVHRRAIHNPRPKGPSPPSTQPAAAGGHNPRGKAPSTFPSVPSRPRRAHEGLHFSKWVVDSLPICGTMYKA